MSRNVDVNCSYVTEIQEKYKVQVMFKTRPKLHATLVLVKGVEWEVDQVKQATMLLMEFFCENLTVYLISLINTIETTSNFCRVKHRYK